MSRVSLALKVAIGLLMVDSIIELSFVSSMVGWIHRRASQGFLFNLGDSTFLLAGEPLNIMVDQGHTSNGAAGTAFVLIGLGGIIALTLRSWSRNKSGGVAAFSQWVYYLWLLLTVLAFFLTTGALGYVFSVTNAHEGQTIDTALAAGLNGDRYPLDSWTPQNWFSAVLQLDLVDARGDIQSHLSLMRGWQYNLIPMFLVQLVVTVLAWWEFLSWRRQTRNVVVHEEK
ncbi:uncharacterized protein GGS25DRAFT_236405 [Hypoxylon fragiforme]|uniref:uncharacterized protein n=1 Tax=Hypoxylon fragiforme TaxID=63214 RepID=UPI0020C73779|nr:uncharacterized protein GGS25DRAFT_236405 [Hypoxylon fragiforme]KAI2609837.1 hypothetical protein GGS25DRAFT_236405 [Hypoxylon fragiforme]